MDLSRFPLLAQQHTWINSLQNLANIPLADLETARRVVTFCDLPDEYQRKAILEYWENVPPVSEDYEKARDIIVDKIQVMIKELL
jgi:hypothetical protein